MKLYVIIVSLILIVLAYALLKDLKKNKLNVYFIFLILGLGIWNDFLMIKDLFPDNPNLTMFISRMFFVGPITALYGLVMFSGSYPNQLMSKSYKNYMTASTLWVVFCSLFTPWIVKDVIWPDGHSKTVYSYLYPMWGFFIYFHFLLIFINCWRQLKNAFNVERPQIWSLAFITFCFLSIGLTTNFILVIMGNRTYTRIGPAIVASITAYGLYYLMRRFQFFTLTRSYKQIIFGILYFYLLFYLHRPLLSLPFSEEYILIIYVLFATVLFVPLYLTSEKMFKVLFGERQNEILIQENFERITQAFKDVSTYEQLWEVIQKVLENTFNTSSVAIIFNDHLITNNNENYKKINFESLKDLTDTLNVFRTPLERKREFIKNNIHVVVPCRDENIYFYILLGEKKNKLLYSNIDFKLIELIQDQIKLTLSVIRLIEQKKLKESQLFQSEKTSLIGQLTAGVVHEIRNPLTSMTMTLENMKEALIESGADKQTIEKLSQAGQRSAQEMKDFLKSLLDFSRKEEFVKKKFMLKPVIDETMRLINKTAKSHQVNIQIDIQEDLELNADDRKIKQVLINLALNAIDAMPKGGTLNFKAYKDNVSSIYIEISDTGHGIPKDKQKHLFTPFFTTKENGTGLGLTIIKEIMDLHQAEISFTSSSQGTIFKLKFN